MIRALDAPCWRVGTGPGRDPHYLSRAEVLAEEAAAAAERAPRPVLALPGLCWVGECDRCARPFDDEDVAYSPWHAATAAAIAALLRAAGWTVDPDQRRVCCRDCAAAPAELGRVAVTLAEQPPREVLAERTACDQLVLSPRYDRRFGHWLGLELIHRPTGRALPLLQREPVRVLLDVAERLTSLDWSPTDPAHYTTGYTRPVLAALEQVGRGGGESDG